MTACCDSRSGCSPECSCGGLTLGAVDAKVLYQRQAVGELWRRLRADIGSEPLLIQMTRARCATSLALAFIEHGQIMREIVTSDLAEDARHHEHVRRLQRWADEYGNPEWTARLTPDDLARADLTEQLMLTVGEAVRLAAQDRADELLTLTRTGGSQRTTKAPDPRAVPQVQVPTLAHGPTRDRLKLAGHPTSRRLAGYGRQHRGLGGPDIAETSAVGVSGDNRPAQD